jgi:hypothetical protein
VTTEPTPDLRALAEAAEGNGEHIYTHPRDSNKWRENEAWHRAASPGAVLHLLDRIEELEARKPLPLSYRSGVMTSGVEGGATVSLHFTDMAEAEAWFVEITDQYDAALVDKSPNLQEELVDKTAKLQDRPAPLSDDDRLRLRSDVARAIWDVMREHEDRSGHALEDVDHKHQVWDCADAAIKAAHGITGGSS